jgi:hypothetical protein
LKTQAKPQGFKHRLGFAESPAEARRWGALQGSPSERPVLSYVIFFYLLDSSRSHADSFRLRDGRHINRHEVHLIRRFPARVRIGAKKKGS